MPMTLEVNGFKFLQRFFVVNSWNLFAMGMKLLKRCKLAIAAWY